MIVLGLDPGQTIGWGLIDLGASRYVRAYGTFAPDGCAKHLAGMIATYRVELVGVETVERVYPRRDKGGLSARYATELARASAVAGELRAAASIAGARVVLFSAERWRKAFTGSGSATDAAVERALRGRLRGFPAPRRSNAHERDGIGVALFAAERERINSLRSKAI